MQRLQCIIHQTRQAALARSKASLRLRQQAPLLHSRISNGLQTTVTAASREKVGPVLIFSRQGWITATPPAPTRHRIRLLTAVADADLPG